MCDPCARTRVPVCVPAPPGVFLPDIRWRKITERTRRLGSVRMGDVLGGTEEPGHASVILLSRLEMEYRMVVAATRPPAQAEASLLEDEEAQADAEAQGYATIGFDKEDGEDGEEGQDVVSDGYACMGDIDAAEESDDDGVPRTAASDDDADEEATFDASGVPAVLETAARSATGAAPVIDFVAATPIAIVVRLIFGSTTATAWAKTGEEPVAADAEPWVVEFPPLAQASAAAAPLPPGRADAIRHVMAGLTLAPPPPGWAKAVPEAVWKHRLLSAAQRRAAYGHDGL